MIISFNEVVVFKSFSIAKTLPAPLIQPHIFSSSASFKSSRIILIATGIIFIPCYR